MGAIAALVLLTSFVVAIVLNLAMGRKPDCNCFGQLHSEPIRWATVARNAALGAGAALVAWGAPSESGSIAPSAVTLVVVAIWCLVRVARRWMSLPSPGRAAAHGLPVGTPAPIFDGFEGFREAGKPALFIFTNPHCGPCSALLPEITRWQVAYANAIRISVISERPDVAERYLAGGTPAAVVIDAQGRVGSFMAFGREGIMALLPPVASEPIAVRDGSNPFKHFWTTC